MSVLVALAVRRRRTLFVAGICVLFCAVLGARTSAAHSSPPPTMRLDPADIVIQGVAGEVFTVDVVIEEVIDLGGFEFEIRFDDMYFNPVQIRPGPFPGSEGGELVCQQGVVPGIARYDCLLTETGSGVDGSGVVAEVDFSVKLAVFAIAELQLMACQAADWPGDTIVLNGCKNASIAVTAPPPVGGLGGLGDPDVGGTAGSAGGLTGLIAAVAVGTVVLAGAGWCARRRRLR